MTSRQKKIAVCFLLPHFKSGGLEQVFLNTMLYLDRELFSISLLLLNKEGDLLSRLPEDVVIYDLDGVRSSLALPKIISKLKYIDSDLVYSGTNATNLMVLLAKYFTKPTFKAMISEHTPLFLLLNDSKWLSFRKLLMKLLYPSADLFAAPVEEVCEEHKKLLGMPNFKTIVLNNPVLLDEALIFEDKGLKSLIEGDKYFLAVGRLAPEKQYDFLINCFIQFLKHEPDFKLLILGEGEERDKLEHIIKENKLVNKVYLPGFVSNLTPYYKNGAALLASSRREGFGNVLVEALYQGLPVVSTDCPFGPRSILMNGQTGILVELDNEKEYIAAMLRVLHDTELRQHLIREGLHSVEKYKVKLAVKQFESVCKELTAH